MFTNFRTSILLVLGVILIVNVFGVSSDPDDFKLPPVPDQPKFKADGVEYDDGGLGPLYDFARSFINSCLPDFPLDLVKDIIDGNIAFGMDMVQDLLKKFAGYVTALLVGILFLIIFPIVGCCFCCCRLCCKACCDRPKSEDPKADCKKKVYGTIFFVLVVFSLTGNVIVYLSNDRISTALDEIAKNTGNNLEDFDTYLNSTKDQVEQIRKNFHTTNGMIKKQLDDTDIAETVASDAVERLTGGAVHKLQDDAEALNNYLDSVSQETANINTQSAQLTVQAPSLSLSAISITPPPKVGAANVVKNVIKPLTDEIKTHASGITGQLKTAKKQIDDLTVNVDDTVTGLQDTINNAGGFDIEGMKNNVNDFVDAVKPFDKYRWYGGISLAAIISLIVALQFFGLLLGGIGSGCGTAQDPGNKGCLANSGGRMIVASILFIFLFSTLLMLLTTVLFSVGSLFERFGCQPMTDPEFKVFDDMLGDTIDLKTVLKYSASSKMTPSKILRNCRENKAVYVALDVDNMNSMTMKYDDLENTVNKAIGDMKTQLNSALTGTANGNYGGVDLTSTAATLDTLANDISTIDIVKIEKQVTDASNNINTFKTALEIATKANPADQGLKDAKTKTIPSIENSLNKISDALKKVKAIQDDIPAAVADVKKQLKDATDTIQANGMGSLTDKFVNKIENVVSTFMNFTKNAIKKDLGKCGPIWNLYNSIVIVSICHYTVDALNGFWFSIGWCIFFFAPSVVFGIKLSNQFRNTGLVNVEDGISDRKQNASGSGVGNNNEMKSTLQPILGKSNKVGHQDF